MFLCSCFMFVSSINPNRKSNMRFPQRRRQKNTSGGQALAWGSRPCPLPPHPRPSPPFSPSCPFLPSPPFLPLSSLPLTFEVGPQNPAGRSGERCKLRQRSLGRSSSRQTIWCILALKSDICWQQFNNFFYCKTFIMTGQPSSDWGPDFIQGAH